MTDRADALLGPALRRAWIAYQRRLDDALAAAGFDERRFPDTRVLRLCRDEPGTTISGVGRALGVSRQAAAKIVARLDDQGYVTVEASPRSGREKTITLTAYAHEYLAAHRAAARRIDAELRRKLGPDSVAALTRLLDALGATEEDRLRDYLREKGVQHL